MNKRKNAVVVLATQPSNMGDLLINKSLTDNLSKYVNLYIDDKGVPTEFSKYLFTNDIKTIDEFGFSFKSLSALKLLFFNKIQFDYLFFSPGPSGGILTLKGAIKSVIVMFLLTLFRIKGIRIFQIGIDMRCYSIFDSMMYKLKTSFLGIGYFIRSKNNLIEIRKKGVKHVEYIPDLAFMHRRKLDVDAEKDSIGISFRDFVNVKDNERLVNRIDEVVKYYLQKEKKIVFFYQVEIDKKFTSQLFEKYRGLDNVEFRETILWYNDIPEYNKFDLVFSNRLHVLLLGFDYNAIPIALLNSNRKLSKIYNIFNDIEMNNFILDLDRNIDERLKFVDENKVGLIKVQKATYQKQYDLSNSIFKQILN